MDRLPLADIFRRNDQRCMRERQTWLDMHGRAIGAVVRERPREPQR
jgi:hypothetical protein